MHDEAPGRVCNVPARDHADRSILGVHHAQVPDAQQPENLVHAHGAALRPDCQRRAIHVQAQVHNNHLRFFVVSAVGAASSSAAADVAAATLFFLSGAFQLQLVLLERSDLRSVGWRTVHGASNNNCMPLLV